MNRLALPSCSPALRAQRRPASAAGFTLVEVLVALFIMAVLAGMAWTGIDGLVRTRDGAQAHAERTLQLATVLSQWEQDLQQVQATPGAPPLRFDGAALRLTRRTPDGLQLVVWTVQENQTLYRWTSPPLTRLQDLQEWWLRSQQWTGMRDQALAMWPSLTGWQVYYYRQGDNTWSNAQSSAGRSASNNAAAAAAAAAAASSSSEDGTSTSNASNQNNTEDEDLPQGVRLVLTLPEGPLTRDVMLQQQAGGG